MRGGLFFMLLLLPVTLAISLDTAVECPPSEELACGTAFAEGGCRVEGTYCPDGQECFDGACILCYDQLPDPAEIPCGQSALTRLCSGQLADIVGTDCPELTYCSGRECIPQEYVLEEAPDNQFSVVAGGIATLHVQIYPALDNVVYQAEGWITGGSSDGRFNKRTTNEDVGRHEVRVTAIHVGGLEAEELAREREFTIEVYCNAEGRDGACCIPDSSRYRRDGAACEYTSGDENSGTCSAGICERLCIPGIEQRCDGEQIRWFDSCDKPGNIAQDCGAIGQTCSMEGGLPQCVDSVVCLGNFVEECQENKRVRVDTSCGKEKVISSCRSQVCDIIDGKAICRPPLPCEDQPGTLHCLNACIDPTTNRQHCGECGNACAENELCVNSRCEPVAGCTVICDSNADCREHEICINPGDCGTSQCQPLNILTPKRSTASLLSAQILSHNPIIVEETFAEKRIEITVTNLLGVLSEKLSFTVDIPKSIAASARELDISGASYQVIEDDPVLKFTLPPVASTKTFSIATEKEFIDEQITISPIEGGRITQSAVLESWNKTLHALSIGINSYVENEKTFFKLVLLPAKKLTGLRVTLEIPACFGSFDAVAADAYRVEPNLLIWTFEKLAQSETITFSVPELVAEECREQLRAVAFSNVGKPLSPWLGLLLIPILGLLLVFYQRLFPHRSERLSKEEFSLFAQKQGVSPEQIEADWEDYKRRF